MQFDPKIEEVVARGLCCPHGRCCFNDAPQECEAADHRADATAAIKALCAHLRLPPEALNALAAGEAVVVPREATHDMINGALDRATTPGEGLHYSIWRAMAAASPYVSKGRGDA